MNKLSLKGTTNVVPFDLEKRINSKTYSYLSEHVIYTDEIKPKGGMDIVMVGSAGICASAYLTNTYEDELRKIWNDSFVDNCMALGEMVDTNYIEELLKQSDIMKSVSLVYALSESGAFSGMWEVGEFLHTGMEIKAYDIPIWQEVVELSEVFNVNPYKLDARGSALIVCNNSASVIEYLTSEGFLANLVGHTVDSSGCVITDGESVRYLEPNRTNELKGVCYERRDFETYRKQWQD